MPQFEYKGKTMAGTAVSGEIKAKDLAELDRLLRRKKILVSSASKKSSDISFRIGTGIKKVYI